MEIWFLTIKGEIMINTLISEIDSCLKNECYYAALSLLLIVVDSCAKAEYPDIKNNKERYIKWFETFVCDG